MNKGSLLINKLIEQFASLPGIGWKTAQRLSYYILKLDEGRVKEFANILIEAKQKIKNCENCYNLTEEKYCKICLDESRDRKIVCLVEMPKDIISFEKTGEYKGVYHALHGLISPMDGIGPDKLYIKGLLKRIQTQGIEEVIMATNPTVEGEATAIYLSRLIKPMGIKTTRIAYGIPVGGELEYTDDLTLYKALENRNEI